MFDLYIVLAPNYAKQTCKHGQNERNLCRMVQLLLVGFVEDAADCHELALQFSRLNKRLKMPNGLHSLDISNTYTIQFILH